MQLAIPKFDGHYKYVNMFFHLTPHFNIFKWFQPIFYYYPNIENKIIFYYFIKKKNNILIPIVCAIQFRGRDALGQLVFTKSSYCWRD